MEISENERMMLIEKKEEINRISNEILEIYSDPNQTKELQKKLNNVICLLNIIACYAKSDRNIDAFTRTVMLINHQGKTYGYKNASLLIEIFCTCANSVQFDFTKSRIELHLPDNLMKNLINIEIPKFP